MLRSILLLSCCLRLPTLSSPCHCSHLLTVRSLKPPIQNLNLDNINRGNNKMVVKVRILRPQPAIGVLLHLGEETMSSLYPGLTSAGFYACICEGTRTIYDCGHALGSNCFRHCGRNLQAISSCFRCFAFVCSLPCQTKSDSCM